MNKLFIYIRYCMLMLISACSVREGARCSDGTYSNATWSGACSSHGGVASWDSSLTIFGVIAIVAIVLLIISSHGGSNLDNESVEVEKAKARHISPAKTQNNSATKARLTPPQLSQKEITPEFQPRSLDRPQQPKLTTTYHHTSEISAKEKAPDGMSDTEFYWPPETMEATILYGTPKNFIGLLRLWKLTILYSHPKDLIALIPR